MYKLSRLNFNMHGDTVNMYNTIQKFGVSKIYASIQQPCIQFIKSNSKVFSIVTKKSILYKCSS